MFLALLPILLLLPESVPAQSTHPVTGRPVAPVMGISGADWLDRHERETEEQPDKAIAELNLKPGMLVAMSGAGTGFYSLRIAKRVGPAGIVYANDIQPGMLERLRANASAQHVSNVVTDSGHGIGSETAPRQNWIW